MTRDRLTNLRLSFLIKEKKEISKLWIFRERKNKTASLKWLSYSDPSRPEDQ